MRLSVVVVDVVGVEGDGTTTVIGKKSNSIRTIRGLLYGSTISGVSVKILMFNQLEKNSLL